MLGIDSRTARATWTVLLILALVGAAYLVRRTLLIFICAILLAYLLDPLLQFADRFRPARVPSTASLLILYLAIMAVLALAASTVGAQLAREAAALSTKLPEILSDPNALQRIPLPEWIQPFWRQHSAEIQRRVEEYLRESVPLIRSLSGKVLGLLSNLVFVILVPILTSSC